MLIPYSKVTDLVSLSSEQFWLPDDFYYMQLALEQARAAAAIGEVPVGAVLVHFDSERAPETKQKSTEHVSTHFRNATILGVGYNRPIIDNDPTAHAEVKALRCACEHIANYRLPPHTTLYVTLEPCTMCVGALVHARLDRLVFAAHEPKAGMVGSQSNLLTADCYNHTMSVHSGILAHQSRILLQSFFKERRAKKKAERKAQKAQIALMESSETN